MGNSCPCCQSSDPTACNNSFCQNNPSCCNPPYECDSGDSSVRRVSSVRMFFLSGSNLVIHKGVSVNQAGYASLSQANLGGRRLGSARRLIHRA